MSKLRVLGFAISIDGYDTSPVLTAVTVYDDEHFFVIQYTRPRYYFSRIGQSKGH